MKVVCVTFLLLGLLKTVYSKDYHPREGDILFQSLPHIPLVDAIESVSNSKLSHCGIVFRQGQDWLVLEALGEVIITPFEVWTERGRKRWFMACRFRTTTTIDTTRFIAAAKAYLGRPYDYRYVFGNEAIYCSELAYQAFKDVTGGTLGRVMKLGDLNWKPNEDFIRSMEDGGLPLEREMITPVDLSRAPELQIVFP